MDSYIVMSGSYLGELVQKVNEKIKQGYVPTGGLFIPDGSPVFYQAMVKLPAPVVETNDKPDYAKTGIRSI